MFDNKTILVTGGTGSFGNKFVRMTLEKYNPKKIIIYSRDEMKQWEMAKHFKNESRIRFFIGDVRDKDRLYRALDGVDFVVHAAATKIVPTAEYNPFECVKTNINGAMNVIDACIDKGIERVVALSTDKASSPANLYGATKLASDKLFVAGNSYSGSHKTRFAVVRYGNVMGSRGSVIPFFLSIKEQGTLPVTDERMTRFMITLEQGVELVWHAFNDMVGGEIYVKKIPSMKVTDVATAVAPEASQKIIGIRPGEKLHEQMISAEDAYYTYEYAEHFKILPAIHNWAETPERIKDGKKVAEGFVYESDSNTEWMSISALSQWIEENKEHVGEYLMAFIPYGRQDISAQDIQAVVDVLTSDFLTQGPCVPQFEQAIADYVDVTHAIAVNSATSALHIACPALGLSKGDWLWTSPNTFVASANCARYCDASVSFVDIDASTYNMSAAALEEKLIKAEHEGNLPKIVVPVAFAGQSCEMEKIHQLSRKYGFHIIEDASHAIGGSYQGKKTGNSEYADITILSFHPVKIITTAEGGMALTNHDALADKMRSLRSHGITRDKKQMTCEPHGDWYYQQTELGLNYRMTELQAALGVSQLTRIDDFITRRHQIAAKYYAELADLPVTLPVQEKNGQSALHLFPLLVNDKSQRKALFDSLRSKDIGVNVHYIPVHTQPYYQALGFQQGDYPESENYYQRAISIPIYSTLSEDEQNYVIACIREFFCMKVAIIPARGGSKRIPRKNIKAFCGKPMIAWSIEAARNSKLFDKIVVSTDDEEIGKVASGYGAEVPFIRPAALADDFSGTVPVIRHACETLSNAGFEIDYACCIYATAPFIQPDDLIQSFTVLQASAADYCFPVTSYAYPIQRALKRNEAGEVSMFNPELFNTRSQDLTEAWHDAGQFYWGTCAAWLSEKPVFNAFSTSIRLAREKVQDIDTPEDWRIAELLFQTGAGKDGNSF